MALEQRIDHRHKVVMGSNPASAGILVLSFQLLINFNESVFLRGPYEGASLLVMSKLKVDSLLG